MRKIVVLIIPLLVFSCQQNKSTNQQNNSTKTVSDFGKFIELFSELRSQQRYLKKDTLFWDYVFGMSPKDVKKNSIELEKNKTVKLDKQHNLCEIKLGENTIKCETHFSYYDNRLNNLVIELNESEFQVFLSFLKNRLGEPELIYNGIGFLDKRILWIKGNQEIYIFTNILRTAVTFEDYTNQKPIDTEKIMKDYEERKNIVKVENSEWDNSVRQVKDYLKKNLKDPKSYESIEWSEVRKEKDYFIVRHKYRAKNSFGGYVIENQIFYINKYGNVFNVK